jgi:hypothetical protein
MQRDLDVEESQSEESPTSYYLRLLKPWFVASEKVKNDPRTSARNDALLAALDSLPGAMRFEILKLSQYSRWYLWQRPEQMPPELLHALGLEVGTAISYQTFVLGAEATAVNA